MFTSAYGIFQQNLLKTLVLSGKLYFPYGTVWLNDLQKTEGHPRPGAMFENNAGQMDVTKVHKW